MFIPMTKNLWDVGMLLLHAKPTELHFEIKFVKTTQIFKAHHYIAFKKFEKLKSRIPCFIKSGVHTPQDCTGGHFSLGTRTMQT